MGKRVDDDDDGDGGLDGGVRLVQGGRVGERWMEGGGVRRDGWGGRKVVISQLLINIPRLRAFQRNVIN